MTMRTSRKTSTFRRAFVRGGFDEVLPAGAYRVAADDELLKAISFPAYRRVLTATRKSKISGVKRTKKTGLDGLGPDLCEVAIIIGAAALVGLFLC